MDSRRLSIGLIVCLLISNLAVGTLSLVFLNRMNERYDRLFNHSVPVVNDVRTLTRELGLVQRLARRIVDPANEPAWADLLPQLEAAVTRTEAQAHELSGEELFRAGGRAESITAGSRRYGARVRDHLALVRAGRMAEAARFNNEVLRPTYDDLQAKLEEAADFVEQHTNRLRAQYAEDSRFFGGLLLVLGGWPVLAGGLVLLVLAVVVTSLLITVFVPRFDLTKRLFRSNR